MMKEYVGFLAFFLCLAPAWAGADGTAYQPPEYSGPSAKFDSELERYNQTRMTLQEALREQQRDQKLRHNDQAADKAFEQRLRETQGETDRRRDEVRRKYYTDQ